MPSLTISSLDSADAIPREAWTRLCPPGDPFLNADFLAIIERHGAAGPEWGWVACHLTATDAQGIIVGILPLYVRFNSHGDFIHDWSWASAYQQLHRKYYPKLLSGKDRKFNRHAMSIPGLAAQRQPGIATVLPREFPP